MSSRRSASMASTVPRVPFLTPNTSELRRQTIRSPAAKSRPETVSCSVPSRPCVSISARASAFSSATSRRRRAIMTLPARSSRDDLAGNVMIALRRRDVAELNALARALMETHGRLGTEQLTVSGRDFAAGDRIVCLRNSDVFGVKNGTRGTVEAIDAERRELIVSTDRGDRVTLTRRYLDAGQVRHAYALTGHAGQGVTVERAFVLGAGDARLQEWGYV